MLPLGPGDLQELLCDFPPSLAGSSNFKNSCKRPIAYSMSSFVKKKKKYPAAWVCLVHKRPTAIIKEAAH